MENDLPSFKDIKLDPEKFYDRPSAVAADGRWDQKQQQEILRAWKANEEALLRAASEGLAGGERPHLQEVVIELSKFERSA